MSDNDAFDRAVRALRETGETPAADVARTRMRVMETLRRGERRGRRTLWMLLPIAAVLAGGAALAKNGETARRVWTSVAETLGVATPAEKAAPPVFSPRKSVANANGDIAPSDSVAPSTASEVAAPDHHGSEALAETQPRADPSARGDDTVEPRGAEDRGTVERGAVERAAPEAPRGAARTAHDRALERRVATSANARPDLAPRASTEATSNPSPFNVAPEPSAAAAPSDGDAALLELYKNAYRLHFVDQQFGPALAAWDAYLRSAPTGRLVVEARYNRAIALARLGRLGEAESALGPFARGEVSGGYRAREARELLDALHASDH